MFTKLACAACAALFALAAGVASAAPLYQISLSNLSNFRDVGDTLSGPATEPISGVFQFSADLTTPQINVAPSFVDLVIDFGGRSATYDASNVEIDIAPGFGGFPQATDIVIDGLTNIVSGTNGDFFSLRFIVDNTNFTLLQGPLFGYVAQNDTVAYFANTGEGTLGIVPLPAALPMLAGGVAFLGLFVRRRSS